MTRDPEVRVFLRIVVVVFGLLTFAAYWVGGWAAVEGGVGALVVFLAVTFAMWWATGG